MKTSSFRPSHRGTAAAAAALVLALALPSGAAAQGSDYRLFDRWSVVVGSWFESTDTDLRVDGSTSDPGTAIDFEGDLGLGSSDTLFRLRVEFLPGTRHQLNLGYYTLDRDASRVLSREIEFGGEVYPISAEVSAFADLEVIEGSYTYWFLSKDRYGLGGSVGLVYLGVEAGLSVTAGSVGAGASERESTDLPVPVLGLAFKYGLLEKLILHAYGDFLPTVEIGDVDGSLTNVTAALEYRAFEHVGFGGAYNLLDVDVDVDKGSFRGAVDYSIEGGQLYLRLGF